METGPPPSNPNSARGINTVADVVSSLHESLSRMRVRPPDTKSKDLKNLPSSSHLSASLGDPFGGFVPPRIRPVASASDYILKSQVVDLPDRVEDDESDDEESHRIQARRKTMVLKQKKVQEEKRAAVIRGLLSPAPPPTSKNKRTTSSPLAAPPASLHSPDPSLDSFSPSPPPLNFSALRQAQTSPRKNLHASRLPSTAVPGTFDSSSSSSSSSNDKNNNQPPSTSRSDPGTAASSSVQGSRKIAALATKSQLKIGEQVLSQFKAQPSSVGQPSAESLHGRAAFFPEDDGGRLDVDPPPPRRGPRAIPGAPSAPSSKLVLSSPKPASDRALSPPLDTFASDEGEGGCLQVRSWRDADESAEDSALFSPTDLSRSPLSAPPSLPAGPSEPPVSQRPSGPAAVSQRPRRFYCNFRKFKSAGKRLGERDFFVNVGATPYMSEREAELAREKESKELWKGAENFNAFCGKRSAMPLPDNFGVRCGGEYKGHVTEALLVESRNKDQKAKWVDKSGWRPIGDREKPWVRRRKARGFHTLRREQPGRSPEAAQQTVP